MKKALFPARFLALVLTFCLFATLAPLSGCVSDDDYVKTVTQFQQSSDTLTRTYLSFLANANLVEENHFIDSQIFEAQPIDPAAIQSKDLLTPDEIKLRISAIRALADYTTALSTLAAGRPAAQIQTDADQASASLKTLTSDCTTALAHPTAGQTTPDYSGPVSTAASVIGEVIALIEKHRGQQEIKDSLRKNDPQLKALFDLISKESNILYARQTSTLSATGVILFQDYNTARQATPINSVTLMSLSDRIKQYRRDSALIGDADPTPAIAAFEKSHDALIDTILAPKEKRKESLSQLIAAVRAFANEVTPLGENVYALAKSF